MVWVLISRAPALEVMMIDHISEIGLLAVVVRQGGMIQHLQQNIEQVGWAFSISSSSSTLWGCLRMPSVSRPP